VRADWPGAEPGTAWPDAAKCFECAVARTAEVQVRTFEAPPGRRQIGGRVAGGDGGRGRMLNIPGTCNERRPYNGLSVEQVISYGGGALRRSQGNVLQTPEL